MRYLLALALISTHSVVFAQSPNSTYQDLWYGYNQFIETAHQLDLRITCGKLSEDPHKVFQYRQGDYKLVKVNNQIKLMTQGEKTGTLSVVPAEFINTRNETRYRFHVKNNEQYSFKSLNTFDQQSVFKAYIDLVPAIHRGPILQKLEKHVGLYDYNYRNELNDEWRKYFEILNTYDSYHSLDVEKGTLSYGDIKKVKIRAKALSTTVKEAHGLVYTTQKEYYLNEYSSFDCLSWRPFN